jgi:hypothetical protein
MNKITTRKEAIEILSETAEPVPPGLKFTVDRFKPEDAWGVIQCCYSIYGDAYPIDTYYIPEKLIEENLNGNIYGVVARTSTGKVVGYSALYRSSPPFPGIYEVGQLIVRMEYRKTRIAYEVNAYVVNRLVYEIPADAYFGEAVTTHLVTQKMGVRAGCSETGFELDLMPAEADRTGDSSAARVSAVLMFKMIRDRPHDIYLPAIYTEIIQKCLGAMELSRSVKLTGPGPCESSESRSVSQFFDHAGVARLSFTDVGSDFSRMISEYEATALSRDYKVLQMFLNIGAPSIGSVIERLLANGYFFGAYLPRWFDTDGLLLQKLTGATDVASINLYSTWAKELLEFTLKDRERAAG